MPLLSGNVEIESGPFSTKQKDRMLEVMELLPNTHKTQDVLFTEFATIKQKQTSVDRKLTSAFAM